MSSLAAIGLGGRRGSSAILVSWRGTRWSPAGDAFMLPRWKYMCIRPTVKPPNKCLRFRYSGHARLLLLSAGLGGEGEDGVAADATATSGSEDAADAARAWSDSSAANSPSTIQAEGQPLHHSGSFPPMTLWQRRSVQSSDSRTVGQSLPPCLMCCGYRVLFLQAMAPTKRSSGSETACSRCTTPSGEVPGGGAVDRAWQLARCGGQGARRRSGLDCVFASRFRVFFANLQGHVVTPFSSEAVCVICTTDKD